MAYAKAEDQKRYARAHYQANKDLYKARAVASNKRIKAENRVKILAYLIEHPCMDCGENDPIVLQFDHVSGIKVMDVCRLIQRSISWKRIADEIAKCEVVCANCHTRRTARRHGGWWKSNGLVAEQVDVLASNPSAL